MNNSKKPHKIQKPETVDYILLDKDLFVQMIADYKAILKKHIKKSHTLSIDVSGYDGSFESAEALVETLSEKEWCELDSITVRFNRITKNYEYYNDLYLRFTDASYGEYGLSAQYGSELDDVVRLAISQSANNFMYKYRRKVFIGNKVLTYGILTIFNTVVFIWLIANLIGTKASFTTILSFILLVLAGCVLVSLILGFNVSNAHSKIIPRFELVTNLKATKAQNAKKAIVVVGGIITFIGTILGYVSFFGHK